MLPAVFGHGLRGAPFEAPPTATRLRTTDLRGPGRPTPLTARTNTGALLAGENRRRAHPVGIPRVIPKTVANVAQKWQAITADDVKCQGTLWLGTVDGRPGRWPSGRVMLVPGFPRPRCDPTHHHEGGVPTLVTGDTASAAPYRLYRDCGCTTQVTGNLTRSPCAWSGNTRNPLGQPAQA